LSLDIWVRTSFDSIERTYRDGRKAAGLLLQPFLRTAKPPHRSAAINAPAIFERPFRDHSSADYINLFRMLRLSGLGRYKEYGVIFIRLIVGFHLVYGTQDNVFSSARMEEFAAFLSVRGVPFPLFSAFLSAYAQFICGVLFIIGAATRYAALVMIMNFIAALVIAHVGDPYPNMFPALMMLAAACFLLLHGAGELSVDRELEKRKKGGEVG
jgi:putative oxidoreductase